MKMLVRHVQNILPGERGKARVNVDFRKEEEKASIYFVVTLVRSANSVEDQVEQAMLREGKQSY